MKHLATISIVLMATSTMYAIQDLVFNTEKGTFLIGWISCIIYNESMNYFNRKIN